MRARTMKARYLVYVNGVQFSYPNGVHPEHTENPKLQFFLFVNAVRLRKQSSNAGRLHKLSQYSNVEFIFLFKNMNNP